MALAQKDKSLWGAAKVKITLKQGGSCGKTQIVPYGDPELPLPEGAVREKFIRHAAEAAGEPAAWWCAICSPPAPCSPPP